MRWTGTGANCMALSLFEACLLYRPLSFVSLTSCRHPCQFTTILVSRRLLRVFGACNDSRSSSPPVNSPFDIPPPCSWTIAISLHCLSLRSECRTSILNDTGCFAACKHVWHVTTSGGRLPGRIVSARLSNSSQTQPLNRTLPARGTRRSR
ncbi:hypothetical protein BJ912DRAFT_650273 [Pholiota molesta]|nr:hypothetical protein BJ912DRAFT_650273 [Pholiota molesta]